MKHLCHLFFVIWWFHGIAVASGFWMTLIALCPPIGMVISMMWLMEKFA